MYWHDYLRARLVRDALGAYGENVDLMWPVVIENPLSVKIGNRVRIAPFLHIWGGGGVEIGSDVLIASHVAITSETHDVNAEKYIDSHERKPVKIGDNVWIGTHAVIFPGVSIGSGAVIGAGSIVRSDVPPNTIVAGVPARKIRNICK